MLCFWLYLTSFKKGVNRLTHKLSPSTKGSTEQVLEYAWQLKKISQNENLKFVSLQSNPSIPKVHVIHIQVIHLMCSYGLYCIT